MNLSFIVSKRFVVLLQIDLLDPDVFAQGQLAVMIMVSGWMEANEDYKRAFGIMPAEMTFKERLMRFYEAHCPERLANAAEELEDYEETPDSLFDQVNQYIIREPGMSR